MYLGTALKMPSAKAGIVIWVDNKFEVIHDLTAPELDWPPSLIGRMKIEEVSHENIQH